MTHAAVVVAPSRPQQRIGSQDPAARRVVVQSTLSGVAVLAVVVVSFALVSALRRGLVE